MFTDTESLKTLRLRKTYRTEYEQIIIKACGGFCDRLDSLVYDEHIDRLNAVVMRISYEDEAAQEFRNCKKLVQAGFPKEVYLLGVTAQDDAPSVAMHIFELAAGGGYALSHKKLYHYYSGTMGIDITDPLRAEMSLIKAAECGDGFSSYNVGRRCEYNLLAVAGRLGLNDPAVAVHFYAQSLRQPALNCGDYKSEANKKTRSLLLTKHQNLTRSTVSKAVRGLDAFNER